MVLPAAVLVRDRVLDRRVHAPRGGDGGESVGNQLLSNDHADPARLRARVRAWTSCSASCHRSRNKRRSRSAQRRQERHSARYRFNFAFAGEFGRVYKASRAAHGFRSHSTACKSSGRAEGPDYPTYLLVADSGCTARTIARITWMLAKGALNVVHRFRARRSRCRSRRRTTSTSSSEPLEMMTKSPDPHNMRYQEISRVHQRDRAVGRRRQLVARRAGAEDRRAGHVHHHRAVRRAARHEHAARRLGVRRSA